MPCAHSWRSCITDRLDAPDAIIIAGPSLQATQQALEASCAVDGGDIVCDDEMCEYSISAEIQKRESTIFNCKCAHTTIMLQYAKQLHIPRVTR